jgi:hypothetical protein
MYFFFKYFLKFSLIIWLELSLFDLWLFRSFYLRRSSAENFVERDFLIRILFQGLCLSHISVLYNNDVRLVIGDDRHFTHMWKAPV